MRAKALAHVTASAPRRHRPDRSRYNAGARSHPCCSWSVMLTRVPRGSWAAPNPLDPEPGPERWGARGQARGGRAGLVARAGAICQLRGGIAGTFRDRVGAGPAGAGARHRAALATRGPAFGPARPTPAGEVVRSRPAWPRG